MASIFNALPGLEVPAGVISKNLAKMWEDTADKGGPAPSSEDGKATQVNFVLHLGFSTTASDANEQFQTAVKFSRRYPCRVVVLCPLPPEDTSTEIRAKIYGECTLGKSKGDTRCCEFVMLSYPQAARQFLESQVSVCLSTDLPLYYWAHRFSSSARLNEYQYLLRRSTRVMIDSALVPSDALTFPWPRPETVRDLAYARLLPVRQTIGQFLSGYAPEKLVDGLASVTVGHREAYTAEGRTLLEWARERLVNCGASDKVKYTVTTSNEDALSLRFDFSGKRYFRWCGECAKGSALIEADFGGGRASLPAAVSLLSPEAALSEAMFF